MNDVSRDLAIEVCIAQYRTSLYEADFSYRVLLDERWIAGGVFDHPQN